MKVMDVIKKGIDIASKNLNLVLIVFVFNVIWNLGVIPFTPEAPTGIGATMTPAMTVLSLIFILASIFIQGGILGSINDIIKSGKLELSRFTGYGAKFYLRLFFVALIIVLIIGVIGFLATLVVAASAPTKNAALIAVAAIATIILVLAGAAAMLHLFLSPYILVAEDTGVFQAMRMSIEFARRLLLKIIGLGVLLVLIGFGIGLIMGIVAAILSFVIKGKLLQAVVGVINGGVNAYLSIFVASSILVYYLAMKGADSKEAPPSA